MNFLSSLAPQIEDAKFKKGNIMRKFQRVALFIATLLPTYASATDFSYTYVQAAYVSTDFLGVDGNGIALDGSFELNKDFALIAGYETIGFDFDIDLDFLALGAAFHMPVDDKIDAVFTGGLLEAEFTFPGFSDSETGNFLSAGVRVQANPQMEFGLALKRFDLDGAETGVDASVLFSFGKKNQMGLSFSNVADIDNLYFRFRSNF